MSDWNEDMEALLRAVVVGERDERDPRVRSAMEQSQEFRRRLEGHHKLHARLRHELAERERTLAEIRGESPESSALLSQFRVMSAPASKRPRRLRALVLFAGLAAAALVLWLQLRPEPAAIVDDGNVLDAQEPIELLEPLEGPIPSDVRFRWKPSSDPRVLLYEIELYDAGAPGAPQRIWSQRTLETEIQPSIPIPDQLLWRVSALDVGGAPVGPPGEARLDSQH